MVDQKIGGWAFILGVLIAIISGVAAGAVSMYAGWILLLLVVLGVVVGFLNIGDKDVLGFLVASIALMAVGSANLIAIPYIGGYVTAIVQNIGAFVAPAALVVALKEVYNLASKA